MDPKQLALQNKAQLESLGLYLVESDGRVKWNPAAGRGQGYVPPWSWAPDLVPPEKRFGPDGKLTPEYLKLATPGSDPSSGWHAMYESGGPFTKRSQWDSATGTYEGSIDWATLLGTIGAGGIIAGGIAAGAAGGSTVGGAAATTSTTLPATATTLGSTSTIGIAPTVAGVVSSGAVPAALTSSAPAWTNSSSWLTPGTPQSNALNTGLNTVGTILENRGRQQAADTLAGAAERAGQNTLQATQQSLAAAQQAQQRTQPFLQNPGQYQPGSSLPSFAQMGSVPMPRSPNDEYLRGLPLSQLQSDAANPSTPDYLQSVQGEMARREKSGGQGAAPTGQYLQQLLSSGMNPQEAVARFNAETGRTTGNEAVLYGPEVHGKPTIGLPGSYLSLEGNGWQETQRSPEGRQGGGMPSFAQMGGQFSQGVMPQLQPAPGAYQPVSFANMLTVQRPQYQMPQFVYPNPGQRM